MGLLGLPMAAVLPRVVRADLFGGDIGVLLAQLEQQLQMVSHAISTVQNLVETVTRLGNVVNNTKLVLKQAGSGNIRGILGAAQGLVSVARGVNYRLQVTQHAGQWWDSKIRPLFMDGRPIGAADARGAQQSIRDMDVARVSEKPRINEWYDRLKQHYALLEQQHQSVQDGAGEEGVVAQVQRAHAATALAHDTAVASLEIQTEAAAAQDMELRRQALERERSRKQADEMLDGVGRVAPSAPVDDLGYGLQ